MTDLIVFVCMYVAKLPRCCCYFIYRNKKMYIKIKKDNTQIKLLLNFNNFLDVF